MGRLDLHKLLKQAAIEMSKGIIYYLTENFCRQGSAWQWSEWCGCGNCWELCYWQQLKLALEQYSLAQEVCLDNTNGFAAVFLWEMQGPSPPSAPPSAFDSQRNIVIDHALVNIMLYMLYEYWFCVCMNWLEYLFFKMGDAQVNRVYKLLEVM